MAKPKHRRSRGTGGLFRYHNSARWHMQFYDADGKNHREPTHTTIKADAEIMLAARFDGVLSGRVAPPPEKVVDSPWPN